MTTKPDVATTADTTTQPAAHGHHCQRCGHNWRSVIAEPAACARCKSRSWRVAPRAARSAQAATASDSDDLNLPGTQEQLAALRREVAEIRASFAEMRAEHAQAQAQAHEPATVTTPKAKPAAQPKPTAEPQPPAPQQPPATTTSQAAAPAAQLRTHCSCGRPLSEWGPNLRCTACARNWPMFL